MQVLRFDEMQQRQEFLEKIKQYFGKIEVRHNANPEVISETLIYKNAFTKADRSVLLEKFFRVSFAHVSSIVSWFPPLHCGPCIRGQGNSLCL